MPIQDASQSKLKYRLSEIEHHYGPNVHILSDPFLQTHLAQLCTPQARQPIINQLVHTIYSNLVKVIANCEFPRANIEVTTRMAGLHPDRAVLDVEVIDANQNAVCVNLARAGTFPSHICFDALNYFLEPSRVRQDHISINRATDRQEKVVGANVSGHKIGGTIRDAIVLFPDPMGATGSTIISAMDIYKRDVTGPAKKFISLHLIVTPEYLRNVLRAHPELVVYAVRLDRGLSDEDVLTTPPGTHWDRERGLNSKQYIVPGGGGFGEILNNSFV